MLPEQFLTRMEAQLGEEFPDFLRAYDRPRAVGLRLNPLKTHCPPELPFTLHPVQWVKTGYFYDAGQRPGLHPWHEAGLYYLQEPSAMAPAELLCPQPGERVLDLCAAPGGKSTQLAGKMEGQGLLVCNEYSQKRAKILSQNIERMGISNALVINETTDRLAERFPGWFHRVLVDAPCSGEGMFRKEQAAIEDWSMENVALCARRQAEILDNAAKMLAPGGRLVYSTCTFSPEENEETMLAFLDRHPEFRELRLNLPWFTGTQVGYRLWPHKLLGEGHYVAVLEKTEGQTERIPTEKGTKLPALWQSLAKELDITLPGGKAIPFGRTWFWAPEELPELKGLRVLRPGLELGEEAAGRFTPAHALALWLKTAKSVHDLQPDSPEIAAYLAGETLPGQEKGWTLMTVGGLSIGWAKGSGGMLKNHYPKGLRRRGQSR